MDGFFKRVVAREIPRFSEEGDLLEKTGSVGELDDGPSWWVTKDPIPAMPFSPWKEGQSWVFPRKLRNLWQVASSNILQAGTFFFPQGVKIGNSATRFSSFFHSHIPSSEVEAGIFGSGFRSCGLFGVDLLAVGSEKETSLATLHLGLTTGRWFEDFHGSKAWVQKSCYKVIWEMFTLFCLPDCEEGLPIWYSLLDGKARFLGISTGTSLHWTISDVLMEEIRQTSSSIYATLANVDDSSYIGSEIRSQKAPDQTPVFLSSELIYLNCLATDFFQHIHLSAVNYDDYLGLITGSEKNQQQNMWQIQKGQDFFFASNVFFDIFYIIQSNQQQVLHPRIWISGGVLRWSEIPNSKKKHNQRPTRTKGSKVAEAGIEAAFSSGIQRLWLQLNF